MYQAQKAYKITLVQRNVASIMIQKWVRGYLARKKLQTLRIEKATITIQKHWRCYSKKKEYLGFRNRIILLQSNVRMWISVKAYRSQLAKRKEAAIIVQKYARRFLAIQKLKYLIESSKSNIIKINFKKF